jgi:hypothetical protein
VLQVLNDMQPFRVFVSSPVTGIELFRTEIMSAARYAKSGGQFEFYFFEEHENVRVEGKTICESIFEVSGIHFDAFFIFFRDRVGNGTREELDFLENTILKLNPGCQVWWTQIYCEQCPQDVEDFIGRLQNYNTGLRVVAGEEMINSPRELKGRFTAKLHEISGKRASNIENF